VQQEVAFLIKNLSKTNYKTIGQEGSTGQSPDELLGFFYWTLVEVIKLFIQSLFDTWRIVPRVLIIMFLSLYASQVLIELGLFKKLEFIGRPLASLANLPREAGITFVASFGSVIAGNAIIAKLYHDRRIDSIQTLLSALLNTTPVYLKEIFTYQIPVMIPLLGIRAGLLYFLTFIVSGIVKVLFVIIYGRIKLQGNASEVDRFDPGNTDIDTITRSKLGEVLVLSFVRQKRIFLKVAIIFVSTTFFIFLLINNGIIKGLADYVQPLTEFFKLPSASVIPVGTYMFSPLVGVGLIGAMIKHGILSELQGVTACLLGSLLMLPIFAVRYSFAKYASIFGFSMGSKILFVSTGLGMLNRVIFLMFLLIIIK